MSSHLARYEQIGETLARHGLAFLIGGPDGVVPFHRGLLGHERREQPYARPEHVRMALEELGPTFVKLGQLLSTRPDLLPPAYADELATLQDHAPAVPLDAVRAAIRDQLGRDPEEAFAHFGPEPLAAASIGQVHPATLADGTSVVVKVRRPRVVEQVEEDLEILQNLAVRAARRWELVRDYDLPALAQEFAGTMRAELDYLREGRNAERFAADFAGTDVLVPRVFWETTTSRVLTLERVHGTKVDDLEVLEAAGVDRKRLARRGADILLTMIFDHRFFHADPHPGNLFVQPDGTIALIDFGMVGEVDERLHGQLADFLDGFTSGDPDRLAAALIKLSVTKRGAEREALRASLTPFVALYRGRGLGEIRMGRLLAELYTVVRKHHLQLPAAMAALLKVLVMAEGMAARLDPDFDLVEVLTPYSRRLILERASPLAVAKRLAGASVDAGELLVELPGRVRRLFDLADVGGLEVHLRAAELEPLVGRVERVGNRLVAGIVSAALITGVGQLVSSDGKWRSWEGRLLGLGVGTVGALGGYLLWSAGKRPPSR